MISKIVITGGPCGGKSTALERIKSEFEKINYKVFIVNETATELINSGATMADCGVVEFQKNLLKMQLAKEESILGCAKALEEKYEKILVVFDRGAMDARAYTTKEEFDKILSDTNKDIVSLRDRYDAVFHLVTAADGAVEHYTLSNNSARSETPKEAVIRDKKLISAWCGHPHLRIIDNRTDFDGKLNRLIKEIKASLGEPKPVEIERKFLIEYPDISYLESLDFCRGIEISQTYYIDEKGKRLRVRKRGEKNNFIYFKTEKRQISPVSRIEIEDVITENEYEKELNNAKEILGKIIKTRYCLVSGNRYFELDIYPFWSDKAILEIELCDENEEFEMTQIIAILTSQ